MVVKVSWFLKVILNSSVLVLVTTVSLVTGDVTTVKEGPSRPRLGRAAPGAGAGGAWLMVLVVITYEVLVVTPAVFTRVVYVSFAPKKSFRTVVSSTGSVL